MSKTMVIAVWMLVTAGMIGTGCQPEPVGAPCTPETDKGDFRKDMANTTFGVETRSVQCETEICVTMTQVKTVQVGEGTNDYDRYKDNQTKFSFCSCRCMDGDGNKYDRNDDRYDDLCECPPNTKCEKVLGNNIADAPDKIKGSYCVPNCILEGCTEFKMVAGEQVFKQCLPSSDSDEPWMWKCKYAN